MIKAAIIIERVDISLGGAERSVSELTDSLRSLGVDVTLLAAKGNGGSNSNIKVLCGNWPQKRTPYRVFMSALYGHINKSDYDIIHSTLPFAFADIYQPRGGSYKEAMLRNADSYPGKLNAIIKKSTHFLNRKRYRMIHAEKMLCRKNNNTVIAALSGYVKDQFEKHYALGDDRIKVIPNAIKLKEPANPNETKALRDSWLQQANLKNSDNPAIFLFGANNFRLKGLPSLIKAVKIIKTRWELRDFCVVVAGNGEIDKYRSSAKELGVEKSFIFTGALENLNTAICASDVAVLPTFYDPCSRFILEALSQNKPVITTQYNGASERYKDHTHGITLINPQDENELAEAVAFFLKDENIERASKAIINDNIKENLSIELHASRMIELYKEIINRRNS